MSQFVITYYINFLPGAKKRAIVFDKSDLFGLPRLHDGGETSVVVAEELRTLALASTGLH